MRHARPSWAQRSAKVVNGAAVAVPAWGIKAALEDGYRATEWWELVGIVGVLVVVWFTGNAPEPWSPPEREVR